MKKSTLFIFVISLYFQLPLFGQLSPQQAISEMGRGINLGNTLEPPREGDWNNGPAKESYFDAYLDAGFKNIRIPVRWDQHTSNEVPYAIDANWMDRVEEVVDWGLSRGFYITVNGHHEDWLKNNYNDPNLRARYDSIWVQVSERLKDKSDKLLFEIINEPKGMTRSQVDDLNARILSIIRKTNPTRIVIYSGNEWSNSNELINAAIPNDEYIIGYYHAYDPWNFSGLGNGTWGTDNDYQQLNNKYQSVKNWSDANGIPVHHSEFGAVHACDYNSRMRIYAHNVERCVAHGFAFSVWDDGGNFGILNRQNNSWPEVKDILMHYHEDSPNKIFSSLIIEEELPSILVEWNNRSSNNGPIIIERAVSSANQFSVLDTLAPETMMFMDENIEEGTTYTYRVFTTREDGTLLHGYPTRIRINATAQSSFNDTPIKIPGVLEMEEYDKGGEGLAYHDNDQANIPAGFRLDEGVDIGVYGSGYVLEYVELGEWIEYTVNVEQTGTYSISAIAASEMINGTFNVVFDKNDASTSFTIPNTGGWYTFQLISGQDEIYLEKGEQVMRFNVTNNNAFNVNKLVFNLRSVGVSEIELSQSGFLISPNPTDGPLKVDLSNGLETENLVLQIFDRTGKQVETFEVHGQSNMIDVSHLGPGLYYANLIHKGRNLAHSFIIR